MHDPVPDDRLRRCRVLYVSPLKALAVDVERNLRSPLVGIEREAARLGLEATDITIGIRTGDTPPAERARLARRPPDILITTPESLFLMLTSQAREALRGIDTVILDEVHAIAGTKRGAHLALSLERLDLLLDRPAQRIGLSATVSPLDTVASFVRPSRPATVVAPPEREAVGPADPRARRRHGRARRDDGDLGQRRRLGRPHVDLAAHRRAARRPHRAAPHHAGLRQQPAPRRAHHRAGERDRPVPGRRRGHAGSPADRPRPPRVGQQGAARADRGRPEGRPPARCRRDEQPRARHRHGDHRPRRPGRDPAQRRQRAAARRPGGPPGRCRQPRDRLPQVPRRPGHVRCRHDPHAGGPDRGPAHPPQSPRRPRPADRGVRGHGRLDRRRPAGDGPPRGTVHGPERRPPRLGARHAVGPLPVGRVRRAPAAPGLGPRHRAAHRQARCPAPCGHQRRHHPRPRAVRRLPRGRGRLTGRRARRGDGLRVARRRRHRARRLVVAHRGHHARPGPRVARAGPARAACRSGTATRSAAPPSSAAPWARSSARSPRPATTPPSCAGTGLDERASANLRQYLAEQREATAVVPSDTTIVVERFRDELGDWRVVVHTPFGAKVHAPWALVIGARIRDAIGIDAQRHARRRRHRAAPARRRRRGLRPLRDGPHHHRAGGGRGARDGGGRRLGAVRLPLPRVRRPRPAAAAPAARTAARRCGSSASGPRTCSASRREYASFPIILETVRECLQDVYDVPGPARDPDRAARRPHPRPRGGDRAAVAVRAVPAVRLRRVVPLRGRLAAGRAPRRRP